MSTVNVLKVCVCQDRLLVSGQLSLKSCSVLVVGVGGLGCPASLYLAGAGIGLLGLLDYDVVELSNLHRQVLHTEQAEGKCKPESAKVALSKSEQTIVSSANMTVFPY